MTLGNSVSKVEALSILLEASRFQLGDAMRIAAAGPAVQTQSGFDPAAEILAHGVLNDALRYLETGSTSGLRYGSFFFRDVVVPVRERVA